MPHLMPAGTAPASSEAAIAHFGALLSFETDCWDVQQALRSGGRDFVMLDVRDPSLYDAGHIPGAANLPYARIIQRNLVGYAADTLFVVYCSGPHCNGADQAALRLARLRRPVKKMIGGIEGWKDEGFPLTESLQTQLPVPDDQTDEGNLESREIAW